MRGRHQGATATRQIIPNRRIAPTITGRSSGGQGYSDGLRESNTLPSLVFLALLLFLSFRWSIRPLIGTTGGVFAFFLLDQFRLVVVLVALAIHKVLAILLIKVALQFRQLLHNPVTEAPRSSVSSVQTLTIALAPHSSPRPTIRTSSLTAIWSSGNKTNNLS